jgi:hypothetical protein
MTSYSDPDTPQSPCVLTVTHGLTLLKFDDVVKYKLILVNFWLFFLYGHSKKISISNGQKNRDRR